MRNKTTRARWKSVKVEGTRMNRFMSSIMTEMGAKQLMNRALLITAILIMKDKRCKINSRLIVIFRPQLNLREGNLA